MHRYLGKVLHLYCWPTRSSVVFYFCGSAIAGWIVGVAGMFLHSWRLLSIGGAMLLPFTLWGILPYVFWLPVFFIDKWLDRRRGDR